MMREIVLDTETTGLDPRSGDRIVEIGAVELINHVPTGQTWHRYVNPERAVPAEAFAIHGLGDEFLRDKPVFADVRDGFLAFIGDARLVIHNAAFDIAFLDAELVRAGAPALGRARALDTLEIARSKFPGAGNSLDALCRRFGIDNSRRDLHGALLDARLLAEVYLELVGGRQPGFALAASKGPRSGGLSDGEAQDWTPVQRQKPVGPRITAEERAAHRAFVEGLGAPSLWYPDAP